MESSSLFLQHYEFLDVFLKQFQWFHWRRLQMKALRWQSRDQQFGRRRDPLIWWCAIRGYERLFTMFGTSDQSGECRRKRRSAHSLWKQLTIRFKIRSRIFSSESTTECLEREQSNFNCISVRLWRIQIRVPARHERGSVCTSTWVHFEPCTTTTASLGLEVFTPHILNASRGIEQSSKDTLLNEGYAVCDHGVVRVDFFTDGSFSGSCSSKRDGTPSEMRKLSCKAITMVVEQSKRLVQRSLNHRNFLWTKRTEVVTNVND